MLKALQGVWNHKRKKKGKNAVAVTLAFDITKKKIKQQEKQGKQEKKLKKKGLGGRN
jgi:hypothetical protein